MITRRSLLGACLAGFAAPAIVKAEILMPVRKIVVPDPWGVHGYVPWGHYTDKIIENEAWMAGYVGSPEYRAAQRAMNRQYRAILDNARMVNNPRFPLIGRAP